jgi:hypothetical protein
MSEVYPGLDLAVSRNAGLSRLLNALDFPVIK